MKWFFFIDCFDYCPSGNDGQAYVPVRTMLGARKFANHWKAGRNGHVYMMTEWTQAMCELKPAAFVDYIKAHGTLVA